MSEPHRFRCLTVWSGEGKAHRIEMEGKPTLETSAGGAFGGDERRHNPEDMLVAALSSCHMLSYLWWMERAGIEVLAYEDRAEATMQLVERKMRFTEALLRPRVTVAKGTDADKAKALHEKAHETCFIANSVSFPVRHEAEIVEAS